MPATEADVFPFRFAPRYRVAGLVFGVTPRTARVRLTKGELRVRYGPWRLRTPLDNISRAQRSGGFLFIKTAGPARLSLADRGVSFTTNPDDAVCLSFREPVPAIDPFGTIRHPGATLSLADPDGFLRRLGELGVPTGSG